MKKKVSQRAGWIFVAVFVGLHLLYCALDLMRCITRFDMDTTIYELVEQGSTVLRFFLAGSSFTARTGARIWPQDIAGACLIGSFVVAATIWPLRLEKDLSVLGRGVGAIHLVMCCDRRRGGPGGSPAGH